MHDAVFRLCFVVVYLKLYVFLNQCHSINSIKTFFKKNQISLLHLKAMMSLYLKSQLFKIVGKALQDVVNAYSLYSVYYDTFSVYQI